MTRLRTVVGVGAVVAVVAVAGVAGAYSGVRVNGGRGHSASLDCPGGMSRLGQIFSEASSTFPDDPPTHITLVATIDPDGYQVEKIEMGTHTGTHIDAPGHFIDGGRTIDDLQAREFVWPAYVVDVRGRIADPDMDDDFQLSIDDLLTYEHAHGKIASGSMVIIRTGFEDLFGTPAYGDPAPGFSGEAVQWMVDERNIGGIGSDTFGPDATSDAAFDATYTILANDRVAMPGLANLDTLGVTGDIIIASAVALQDGSGFETDPLACLGRPRR